MLIVSLICAWLFLGVIPIYLQARKDGHIDGGHIMLAILTSVIGPLNFFPYYMINHAGAILYKFKDKK